MLTNSAKGVYNLLVTDKLQNLFRQRGGYRHPAAPPCEPQVYCMSANNPDKCKRFDSAGSHVRI